jgi:UDP-N-acetylmuramoyl-L-alanyl-D-glutamate--2,6-diaminopimelate ligase
MRDIERGCIGDYVLVPDRAQAIRRAIDDAAAGDCIVIAGKGHENYQLVEGERLFFSDEQQAREALALRGSR